MMYLIRELKIPSVLVEAGFYPIQKRRSYRLRNTRKNSWAIYIGDNEVFNELDQGG